ncbi:MAG: hypothetical protein BWY90_01641 [Deltaproteobacteria bacterium ADurb.BinA014]|nr:MAG: hypothetical protein BWY90_01641 [Deltaproteobacteria bacterium ADurb.BinA014]
MAIGSLLPDSNSKSGFNGSFSPTFFERRMANTAAASVEETIEPIKKALSQGRFRKYLTNNPTSKAVITTPAVDNTRAGLVTIFTDCISVDNPPANRM